MTVCKLYVKCNSCVLCWARRGRGSRATSEERLGAPTVAAAALQPFSPESMWDKLSNSSDKKVYICILKEERLTNLNYYLSMYLTTYLAYIPIKGG